MARGWESKSIQAQIDAAHARQGVHRLPLTPEQIAMEKKRDSLLLHRTRVIRDIAECRDPRYRKTLEDGLAYLEGQLAEVGWQRPKN